MKTTCGLFFINENDELLCVHPTNHPIDVWSVPKGLVNEGESELKAAIRETYEETSILVNTDEHVFHSLPDYFPYNSKKKQLSAHVIFEEENTELDFSKFQLECLSFVKSEFGDFPEVDSFGWVHVSKARHFIHPTQAEALGYIATKIWPDLG